ncbi:hypothetical protein KL918_003905 [Ogataea parapolymorpha]|uniref:ATPase of the AAA family n=1 Tax=Ogataea parapolymorpha (strain ATCC 26012 / BCRC 20466 / JCM 22074 / NRRL Y-7560 / DL-1) TaxID=871575 RepID=W1QCT3_OGAPD|nr:putative ATPase of the AAA family [Ogataea parapolymorpha DL-1]ESW98349.1 putative ATPase of the AAA family [Ogataea parapolymorpha DL-1]KAG7865917.1 hypothetical protein KL918_003905 [Ogataea parapolymorpha]KAG7874929.1 hypothetical protein KL916_001174 [Ogataea parapolymorpha]
MFSRKKKEPSPPLPRLLEIYNEIANTSLTNLSLEQNNRSNEALNGWRTLHQAAAQKVEALEKSIAGVELTDEESYILDEIHILQAQADDHMDRLENKLNPPLPIQASKVYSNPQHSSSSAGLKASPPGSRSNSVRANVPTLRSSNPVTMNSKRPVNKPLIKSLRPNQNIANNNSSGSLGNSISSQATAKQAANLIWAPSKSLSTNKTYSSNSQEDLFQDFDGVIDDEEYHHKETLRQLQQNAFASKAARSKNDEDLIDLSENLSHLDIRQKPTPQPKQQVQKNHAKSSAERARAALKISSQVKLPQKVAPSAVRQPARHASPARIARSPPRSTNVQLAKPQSRRANLSPGPTKPVSRPQSGSRRASPHAKGSTTSAPKVLADNSTKDTETLDSDNSIEDDEDKLIASMRGVDPVAARQILNEIVVHGDEVHWDDIAGLDAAKNSLKETVVYPFLRPDLFSGLREPARGMLLFGPPGTGKTMLARAVATESKSTFFSISASSLTSKYLGESEKLVRALFQLAKRLAPSIIFVDEIDSLLGSRNNEGENESSRRIKNEFLVQWSDLTKAAAGRDQGEDLQRVLVLAATNLPWAIDEAARRRFVRRQYIPLPEYDTRKAQLQRLLSHQNHTLTDKNLEELIQLTDSFSGSDITALAKDAAMGPLRELGDKLLLTSKNEIRPVCLQDFINSLNYIRPSVSKEGLRQFEEWAKLYGSSGV